MVHRLPLIDPQANKASIIAVYAVLSIVRSEDFISTTIFTTESRSLPFPKPYTTFNTLFNLDSNKHH